MFEDSEHCSDAPGERVQDVSSAERFHIESLAEKIKNLKETNEALIRVLVTDASDPEVWQAYPTLEQVPYDSGSRSFLCSDGRNAKTKVNFGGSTSATPELIRKAKNEGDEELYSLELSGTSCETGRRCDTGGHTFKTTTCHGHMSSTVKKVLLLSTKQHPGWEEIATKLKGVQLYRRPKNLPVFWHEEAPKPYEKKKKEGKKEKDGKEEQEQGEEENVASGSMRPLQQALPGFVTALTSPTTSPFVASGLMGPLQQALPDVVMAITSPTTFPCVASGSMRPLQQALPDLVTALTSPTTSPFVASGSMGPLQQALPDVVMAITSPATSPCVAPGPMRPQQQALPDLVTAIIKNNRNDDADGFYSIVKSLGSCPRDRVEALLKMPEQDPGIIIIAATPEKGEFELSMKRGIIHILATPTEHLDRHLDGTEWMFGSEEKLNAAIGLHTLAWYTQKDAKAEEKEEAEAGDKGVAGAEDKVAEDMDVEDAEAEEKEVEDKEESKEAHMLDLLKVVLEMSDLKALTHQSKHHFLPIHNAAMNGNSIAVSLIANRIIELMGGMGHCSDDKIQASFFQLGNKHYVKNNGPATLEQGLKRVQGMPSGCPLPHDEQGGNLNVYNLGKMLENLDLGNLDVGNKRPRGQDAEQP
eukprot:gene25621-11275_t